MCMCGVNIIGNIFMGKNIFFDLKKEFINEVVDFYCFLKKEFFIIRIGGFWKF